MQALMDALVLAKAEFPEPAWTESMEYLHCKKPEMWSADNYPLVPVLVFDQLRSCSRVAAERQSDRASLRQLADLIENRIRRGGGGTAVGDGQRSTVRAELSRGAFVREILPEIRVWKAVPSLLKSSLRLDALARERDQGSRDTGKAVLAEGSPRRC